VASSATPPCVSTVALLSQNGYGCARVSWLALAGFLFALGLALPRGE